MDDTESAPPSAPLFHSSRFDFSLPSNDDSTSSFNINDLCSSNVYNRITHSAMLPASSSASSASSSPKPKVLFITGASSGIGCETAKLFAKTGWVVVATLRNLNQSDELYKQGISHVLPLDLTDDSSITKAVSRCISLCGRLDVLISCAGTALVGAVERVTPAQWSSIISVNFTGPMLLLSSALPYLRSSGGCAIFVTSALGSAPLPLTAPYAASKAALETAIIGASSELRLIGVKAKLIVPGRVLGTKFIDSATRAGDVSSADPLYDDMTEKSLYAMQMDDESAKCSRVEDVAEVLWKAATTNEDKIRYVVGDDAIALLSMKQSLDEEKYRDQLINRFQLAPTPPTN